MAQSHYMVSRKFFLHLLSLYFRGRSPNTCDNQNNYCSLCNWGRVDHWNKKTTAERWARLRIKCSVDIFKIFYFIFCWGFQPFEDNRLTSQLIKGRHRKRLRESRRHSYTLQEEVDEEDEEKDENNQRIRIIHRERQHQQVQHQGGIDDSHGMKNHNVSVSTLCNNVFRSCHSKH